MNLRELLDYNVLGEEPLTASGSWEEPEQPFVPPRALGGQTLSLADYLYPGTERAVSSWAARHGGLAQTLVDTLRQQFDPREAAMGMMPMPLITKFGVAPKVHKEIRHDVFDYLSEFPQRILDYIKDVTPTPMKQALKEGRELGASKGVAVRGGWGAKKISITTPEQKGGEWISGLSPAEQLAAYKHEHLHALQEMVSKYLDPKDIESIIKKMEDMGLRPEVAAKDVADIVRAGKNPFHEANVPYYERPSERFARSFEYLSPGEHKSILGEVLGKLENKMTEVDKIVKGTNLPAKGIKAGIKPSMTWEPKPGDFIEFITEGGKTVKGKVRDYDSYSKEVWIFPADRSVITKENMLDPTSLKAPLGKVKLLTK